MEQRGNGWRLRVLADGDALRQERLTRALHEDLQATDAIAVGYADGPDTPVDGGRKGGIAGDVALWAAVTAAAAPASRIVITAIREWCGKERHRKVELTYGDHSVTITGRPDHAQERMVREFLAAVRDDASADEPGRNEAQ